MQDLNIAETNKTPRIETNFENGTVEIFGISIPENSRGFYAKLIDWIDAYVQNPQAKTTVKIAMRYLNSSSTLIINKVLKTLDENIPQGKELVFEWYYEEDDFEMKDVGEYYSELLSHEVIFKEVEEI